MLLRLFLLFCWSVGHSSAFNIDDQNPLVFNSPSDSKESDYFGFSVALVPGNPKKYFKYPPWLLIGAPKAVDESRGLQSGQSYKCDLTKANPCQKLPVAPTYTPKYYEIDTVVNFNNSLYGSALDASPNIYLACSPHLQRYGGTVLRMNGACVLGLEELNLLENLELLNNKNRTFQTRTSGGGAIKNFMQAQGGFSVRVVNYDQSGFQLLFGAPNAFEGKGTVALYSFKKDNTNYKIDTQIIPDIVKNQEFVRGERLNFGFSVTSGNFYSKNKIIYASGNPNHDAHGSVLIFDFLEPPDNITQRQIMKGTNVAESFGYSLASGDVTGDGLDDIIVGAPFFSLINGHDEGRVVVYTRSESDLLIQKLEFKGKVPGGRFGTAVAFLGDLNKDKFGDFAVAAPYEDTGVVYIYFAAKSGMSESNIKRIVGSKYNPNISGFGFSISRGVDIDKNGYLDFAIGAYKSGHALIFRTRPVVNLNQDIEIVDDLLTYSSTNFTVRSCVLFTGHRGEKEITLVRKLELGSSVKRIYFEKPEFGKTVESTVWLQKNQTHCSTLQFYFRENITDFETPIKISFKFSLPPVSDKLDKKEGFTRLSPVLMKPSVKEVEISFAPICGNDNNCVADLHVDLRFYDADNKNELEHYVIGSESSLLVRVTLVNFGMPARGSKMLLEYPGQLHPRVFGRCQDDYLEDAKTITRECSVFNPLLANKTETIELIIHSDELDAAKTLNFSALVTSKSNLTDTSVVERRKELKILSEAGLALSGEASAESIRFDLSSKTRHFLNFEFHVEKYGVSPLHEAKITVLFPYALEKGRAFMFHWLAKPSSGECKMEELEKTEEDGSTASSDIDLDTHESNEDASDEYDRRRKRDISQDALHFPENRTLSLNCSSRLWQCASLTCIVGPFFGRDNHVSINVSMQMDFSVLRKHLGPKDIVQLTTEAQVGILKPQNVRKPAEQRSNKVEVTATYQRIVQKHDYFHDPFVISLATIIGLFLLLLMVTGLSKAGFFVRDDLHALKERLRMERPPIPSLKDLQIMYDRDCDDSDS